MKRIIPTVSLLLLVAVLLSGVMSTGCVSNVEGTAINVTTATSEADEFYINSSEDIINLVTDDDKLVINYYDAYVWVVFFDENGYVDNMIYIYRFESEEAAKDMVKTRKQELSQNKAMDITDARHIENYVVVELLDSSFASVTRGILENNFSQLIVF